MKRSDVVLVREDGPGCTELETEGYEVVDYSWGANLRFDDSSDLAMFDERVRRVRNEGFNIRELIDRITSLCLKGTFTRVQ